MKDSVLHRFLWRALKSALLLSALLATPSLAQEHGDATPPAARKKVAVVLSGGGAKGMAHIGVLKVLEKAGIPIDIITGTSMGSIIGGLYSIGYNADLLDSLVRRQDWSFVLSDRENLKQQSLSERRKQRTYLFSRGFSFGKKDLQAGAGLIKGQNLESLFRNLTSAYADSIDFNQLPIRFACVATNIIDNTEHDFHSGILAEAMRASMSIPGAFAPVRKGRSLLVDGGLRNNYPADLARQMGADYIIGVTLQGPPKTADELNTASAILSQIIDINCKNKYDENLAITDIPIRVNTKPYSTLSFTTEAIDSLIDRGYQEAMRHWDEIMKLKAQLGLSSDYVYHKLTPKPSVAAGNRKIVGVTFCKLTANEERFIRHKFNLKAGDTLSIARCGEIATSIRSDLFYNDVTIRYDKLDEGYVVRFTAGSRRNATFNLGLRFDLEEMAAIQANAELPLHTKMPLSTDITLRLGKRTMIQGKAQFHPISFTKMALSYTFRHNDINLYERGKRMYNIIYNQHTAKLTIMDFNIRNFNVDLGMAWDYYHFNDLLVGNSGISADAIRQNWRNEHFISYRANVNYDSEDDSYFPSRGARFQAGYGYYTDNFTGYNHHAGFSALNANWRMSFPIGHMLTLQPMVYGRLLFGSEIPYEKSNLVGGDWFSHYLENQLPLAGVGRLEHADNAFIAAQLKAQLNISRLNYILLKTALAQQSDKIGNLFDGNTYWGMQLAYYLRTIVGPVGASLGWSTRTHRAYFFLNLGYVF